MAYTCINTLTLDNRDDISIMPIEEVVAEPIDGVTLACKRLQREEFWYRELGTVFSYGLNDSVKGVGNVSSRTDDSLVVYTLFISLAGSTRRGNHIDGEERST